jgi:predicted nucleic acid-binding protein
VRAVLADTGPLYALVDPRDGLHERARADLDRLQAERRDLAVPYPVLHEAHTLILHRQGIGIALRWLEEIREGVGFVAATAHDCEAAIARLADYPDQRITLCDAVTATLAQELEILIWSYDHHFDVMGASVWR